MTKAEAKKLCLIKWKYAMETGCSATKLYEYIQDNCLEIAGILNNCGYCQEYLNIEIGSPITQKCIKCPLCKVWKTTCFLDNSPFYKWDNAKTIKTHIKYATQIYNDIKRS